MITNDIQKLEVDSSIILYELDGTSIGADIQRFHGHLQQGSIWWQAQEYHPIAIEVSNVSVNGDGAPAAPTLTLANKLQGKVGAISSLCLYFDDFVGAKLTIIETKKKYLDPINFPDGINDTASNEEIRSIWYIEQKTKEDWQQVEFELSTPMNVQGKKIPARQIASNCSTAICGGYRSADCNYMGGKMFDEYDNPVDDPALDVCGGRYKSCKLRENTDMFGGFIASDLIS